MALTISDLELISLGNRRMHKFNIAFDSSYPTGGESLSLALIRMRDLDTIIISPSGGYLFEYDYDNNKIKAITPVAAGTATLNVTDSDAAAGDGVATYFDEDGTAGERLQFVSPTNTDGTDTCVTIAAAAGAEAAAATDLSGVTGVRCLAIGY